MPLNPGTLENLIEELDSTNQNLSDVIENIKELIDITKNTNTTLSGSGVLPTALLINTQLELIKTELQAKQIGIITSLNNLEKSRKVQRKFLNNWDETQRETTEVLNQLNNIREDE